MIKWISVEDKLPEDDRDVLVYYGNNRCGVEWINWVKGKCYGWCGEDNIVSVTHWMPLPESPKD